MQLRRLAPYLLILASGTAFAAGDLEGIVGHSLEALRRGGKFEQLPAAAKSVALRKLLGLQGISVPAGLEFSQFSAGPVARAIRGAVPGGSGGGFEASVQSAAQAAALRRSAPAAGPAGERRYVLGARDVLAVAIFGIDQGDEGDNGPLEISINNAGFISLPLIGKVNARGKTTGDLEATVTQRYRRFVKDPQVSIYVKHYRAKRVFVVGQVNQNGEISLQHERTTLFEVISRAGGFLNAAADPLHSADPRNVLIQRGGKKIRIDFYGEAIDTSTAMDFVVQDGDQVFVPKPLNRVRVLGGVKNAGEFVLLPEMTLMDAIAKAGSFTEKSRRDQVRILSRGGGRENTTNVDATRIFHGRAKDIPLSAGDVIYISEW